MPAERSEQLQRWFWYPVFRRVPGLKTVFQRVLRRPFFFAHQRSGCDAGQVGTGEATTGISVASARFRNSAGNCLARVRGLDRCIQELEKRARLRCEVL